ncbi:hypothetical protein SAMN02983003_0110 [Devosia enhydra]|uniref:Uncharacterized protein n=1 Tax=Devosia enhydra TaxID=665118 RepID=A0A1K2HSF7_9HYPH|nr:hypothetical protein [Devosia enhydra]SFZ80760.1 hypothetical protein SAMN02983003_0110 [Devosia enhydra]
MDAHDELIRQLLPDYQVLKVKADWTKATPEEHQAARAFLAAWDAQIMAQSHDTNAAGRRTSP